MVLDTNILIYATGPDGPRLHRWLADPDALKSSSSLTLSLSRIEQTPGGDDRKIVLQKIALPLSH